ncbi:MAG: tetratricopeptide repeat protein, partial [Candidatus Binatia bacterium]
LARVAALLVLFPSPQQGNQSGRGTLALTGFQRSLALAPTWPELWEETGKFFLHLWPVLNQDERRFATACLERALLLAPERTEAILAFAFPIDPNLPAAVSSTDPRRGFAAARLYRQHRDSERAHRQARQVAARLTQEVTQDTGAFSSLLLLGEVQLFLGNHKEAKAVYEQGFTRASDPAVRGDFCWHLADWYYDREDYITAGDYYRRYLMLAPDTPEAMLRLGICTLRTGKREEGVRWLERAAELRLEDAAQRIQLAQAFEEAGRYDRANALYRRLLAQEAQPRPDLLLSLARNYIHLGLQREALSVYQQLLVVDTANAEARMFIDSVGKPRQPAR